MPVPENAVNVPLPAPAPQAYSRAAQLLRIILAASFQLRQDADHLEQEDLALQTRLGEIDNAVGVISLNDPLFHPKPPSAA